MKRLRAISGVAWAVATSIVALLTALVPLIFQLAPQWRPDPRENVSADISVFALEPKVTLDDWLDRRNASAVERERILGMKPKPEDLTFEGEVVYVRVRVQGSKGRSVRLRARLYNARRQMPVPLEDDPITYRSSNIPIDAPSRSSVQLLFLADLSVETEPQFVRVELLNEDGVLAVDDSPVLLHGKSDVRPE